MQHLLVHKFFWIYPHSQQQESWIIPFIIVMTWGRHCRVSRIPWGVHDEELDNGRKKVALGAITGRECVMPTQEWLTIWYYLFLAGQSSYKLFYNQGWLTIWHYLFLAGQNSYDLFPHQVADYLVLFVSGRPEQLQPIPPSPEWLIIWHYVFLAGHMMNCGGVKGLLQAR